MVENIKSFEERIQELVKQGKENGFLTYEQIAKKTIDLELDSNSLDELYNTLIENQIDIKSEDENDSSNIVLEDEDIESIDIPNESKDMSVNDNVRMYLKEIGKISLLNLEEEQNLSRRVAEGDEEAKMKELTWENGYITEFKEDIDIVGSKPMTITFVVSAQVIKIGGAQFEQNWPK